MLIEPPACAVFNHNKPDPNIATPPSAIIDLEPDPIHIKTEPLSPDISKLVISNQW